MEKRVKSLKEKRQRKFLLALPLLLLPFMTMMFWALGGGKTEKPQAAKAAGFNFSLPDPTLKNDMQRDKMSYYDQARKDSVKFLELIKNDPNFKSNYSSDTGDVTFEYSQSLPGFSNKTGLNHSLYDTEDYSDANSKKIYQKLAELDKELNKPLSTTGNENDELPEDQFTRNASVSAEDINRLEQMMQVMNQTDEGDSEIQQLNGMLEKILDVQHPERLKKKSDQFSDEAKNPALRVTSNETGDIVSLIDTGNVENNLMNGFYSDEENPGAAKNENSIPAVIHETQTIVTGSTIKLRLSDEITVNNTRIPRDNFVFGIASLNGERLHIKINSIRYQNSLFPVELTVYDLDGLEGIYIPGAITRKVAKQSADRSVQNIGASSIDPSWQAQATTAGVEAAKTLFSKKIRLVKVTVKAGYQVLLKDESKRK